MEIGLICVIDIRFWRDYRGVGVGREGFWRFCWGEECLFYLGKLRGLGFFRVVGFII